PVLTAKMLATIDQLSRGRVLLGIGVGWLREEFEALGTPPFEERGIVTDEYVRLMRTAWTTDPVSFRGRYVSVDGIHVLPKPVQPGGIPVWIGGHTDAALRRTATLGDGWHPIGMRSSIRLAPPEYAASARRIQTLAREAGRDPKSITLSLRVPMEVRSRQAKAPAGERPFFQGTAEQVAADIRAYAEVGVTHFVFDSTQQELGAVLGNMDRFAKDVMPRFVGAKAARSRKGAGGLARGARGSVRVLTRRGNGIWWLPPPP